MCGMEMMQSEKCLGKDSTDHAFRHREAVDNEGLYVSHYHKEEPGEVDKSVRLEERHLRCEQGEETYLWT
jgi:hypothetical protein